MSVYFWSSLRHQIVADFGQSTCSLLRPHTGFTASHVGQSYPFRRRCGAVIRCFRLRMELGFESDAQTLGSTTQPLRAVQPFKHAHALSALQHIFPPLQFVVRSLKSFFHASRFRFSFFVKSYCTRSVSSFYLCGWSSPGSAAWISPHFFSAASTIPQTSWVCAIESWSSQSLPAFSSFS